MVCQRRHAYGELVPSGSAVATAFALALARSSGESSGGDADSVLRRWQLKNGGSCAELVVGC